MLLVSTAEVKVGGDLPSRVWLEWSLVSCGLSLLWQNKSPHLYFGFMQGEIIFTIAASRHLWEKRKVHLHLQDCSGVFDLRQ